MKARITDRKVFESLRPLDMVAYLRSEGWALAGYYGESATVWKRQTQQVLLPRDSSDADYPRRADYEAAARAHTQALDIRCRGRLEKEGRYFTLRSIREFGVQEDLL